MAKIEFFLISIETRPTVIRERKWPIHVYILIGGAFSVLAMVLRNLPIYPPRVSRVKIRHRVARNHVQEMSA